MARQSVFGSGGRGARMTTVGLIGVVGVAGASGTAAAQACGSGSPARLQSLDPALDDRLGIAVALSTDGGTLAAGAHWDRIGSENRAGSVSVYTRSGGVWSAPTKLTASDFAASDEFGVSVALSADGTTLAVGAPFDDRTGVSDAGAVYIFVRSGGSWVEQAKLIGGSTGFFNLDHFGGDVAISADGNTVAVGAPRWDQGGFADEGAVHVFTRSGSVWTQVDLLRSSFGRTGDRMGASVGMSSDGVVIAAAAPEDDEDVAPGTLNLGSVSVFRQAGLVWGSEGKLWATDGQAQDRFGNDVAVSGDGGTIAVGMRLDTTPDGAGAGSVRVFEHSGGWTPIASPVPSAPAAGWDFGFCVALDETGDTLLAGSFGDVVDGQIGAGSMYVFDRAGPAWVERDRLLPPEPTITGGFGIAAALAGDGLIAVGEYRYDVGGGAIDAGSVWVYGPACSADLAEPCGVLDFSDVVAFLVAFGGMDPAADLAPPAGVFDFSDVVAFLGAFGAGCP